MSQLILESHFPKSLSALWASNLYCGHPEHHFALADHFRSNIYYLQHFSAAYLYPWILDCVSNNKAKFPYISERIKSTQQTLNAYLKSEREDVKLQEQIITDALAIETSKASGNIKPLFVGNTDLEILPHDGVPFIRDTYFKTLENISGFLADKRSPLISAKGGSQVKIIRNEARLANGTFWVGSNYTLIGLSEFIQSNGLSAPDKTAIEETEKGFKETFRNHNDYPILWVGPDKPIRYRGHDFYYPLTGHLDDFMCPLYSYGNKEVYLFAELNSKFYCGSREAESDVIVNLQRPLLESTAEQISKRLMAKGKTLELIYVPVLWDDAALYPFVNCITQNAGHELIVHLPQFRIEGNERFNTASIHCENEILKRLKNTRDFKLRVQFIPEFNFTENIRANRGGIHCIINPYSAQ